MHVDTLQQMLSNAARTHGDKIALEFNGQSVLYADLERTTNRLARHLIRSVPKGSVIALLIEDRIKLIEAVIAVLKAGCVFMPLSANNPDRRLKLMVEKARPDLFIGEQMNCDRIASLGTALGQQSRFILLDHSEMVIDSHEGLGRLAESDSSLPFDLTDADDMCYIYFTSGSTGVPKAIAGRAASLLHFIKWEIRRFDVTADWRTSQFATPTFDAFLRDIFVPLCAGATSCIPESSDVILDPPELIRWIDENNITLIHCVPSIFRSLLREPLTPEQFGSLKYIIMAGEQLYGSEIKRWMDVFGERIGLVNLYGATENTMAKFCHFIKAADANRKTIPIGRPIDGATAIILDSERNICDPGVVGEIYIRTPFLTLGYYNDPQLTKEVFVQNPFNLDSKDIIYKTGDFGRLLPDGNFELIGRRDNQVKIRGLRVELGEIESVLKQHPGVDDAVVRLWDEDKDVQRLVAYVVANRAYPGAIGELREFTEECLPEHMVPSSYVMLEKLPLTPNGKIDRDALPSPDYSISQSREPFVMPTTPIETALAQIWSQILRVENIGINDSFFSLGGHSMLGTQVMSRVRQEFQVDVPLRDLFDRPTIAGLAAAIEKSQAERREAEEAEILKMIEGLSENEVAAMLEDNSEPDRRQAKVDRG